MTANIQQQQVPLLPDQVLPLQSKNSIRLSFLELMKTIWHFGLTLLGDTYVNVLALRQVFVVQKGMLTDREFETINILAEKSPGIRTTKCIFLICFYKNGMMAGLVATLLFTLPTSILMYIIGRNVHLTEYLVINIALVGFRGATAGLLLNSVEIFQSAAFQNVLSFVSFIIVVIFPSGLGYIYFLVYLITAIISVYSRQINNSIRLIKMPMNKKYSLPALILTIVLFISLWIGNRFLQNSYLYLCQILSTIVAVTTSKNTAVFPMIYGQLSTFADLSDSPESLQSIRHIFLSMVGVAFVMPGPLAKMVVLVCSFFFGLPGALIAYLTSFGYSILFMLIFIKYGYRLMKSEIYRKIITSIGCVNRGLLLYLVYQIYMLEDCDLELVIIISLMAILWLRIYKIHRHIIIWIGGALALSRKLFIWKYRNVTIQQLRCPLTDVVLSPF